MNTDNTRLFYALFVPYFYIQIYANFRGVSPNMSNYLLTILNAMNIPSRVLRESWQIVTGLESGDRWICFEPPLARLIHTQPIVDE